MPPSVCDFPEVRWNFSYIIVTVKRLRKSLIKKQILYNRYYPTFDEFKAACVDFFRTTRKHPKQLRTLLRERLNIIAAPAA